MKKFIKKILFFIPITIFIYILLICIWGDISPRILNSNLSGLGPSGFMKNRIEDIKNYSNVDILFMGSSHAYRGFDPRIFNKNDFTTFNLGSSAQTPLQTEILVERYLDILNPKTIIYEVSPASFCSDGIESTLDIIANTKINSDIILLSMKQNHIKVYNALIYNLYKQIFYKNKYYVDKNFYKDDTYVSGGYVERNISYFSMKKYNNQRWEFNPKQFDAFIRIIDKLRSRNIKIILVQVPVTYELYKSYTNNKEFDIKINSYGDYFNFNNNILLNDSLHFYDSDHLNQNGVKLFNDKLIDLFLNEKDW